MDSDETTPDLNGSVLSERSCLRIPSRPEWIPSTIDFLKQKAQLCGVCQASRAGKLALALHEAITNAVVHGNLELSSDLKERDDDAFARALAERASNPHFTSRSVLIDVDYDGESCRWSFTDEGPGFDFQRYLNREPDPEAMFLSSGRGILLMKAFVDEVEYEQGGRKVTLTLRHSSGVEKRKRARQTLHQRVQVAPIRTDGSVDWQRVHDAVAHDVSETGVGLLQAQLATTDRVLLGVEVEGRTLYIPAQLRHCRAVGEGMVEVGCRFLTQQEPLPRIDDRPNVEDAIDRLLEERRMPRSIDERRADRREVYTERIEIIGSPPRVGFARDLSRGGIAFITTSPLPPEPFVLSLPQPDGGHLLVQAQVVRCVELTPGFYDIGARFLTLESS